MQAKGLLCLMHEKMTAKASNERSVGRYNRQLCFP